MTYIELSPTEKESLIQLAFINDLELLTRLDDFYKKQRVGIKSILGEKHRILIPHEEMNLVHRRAMDEVRFLKKR